MAYQTPRNRCASVVGKWIYFPSYFLFAAEVGDAAGLDALLDVAGVASTAGAEAGAESVGFEADVPNGRASSNSSLSDVAGCEAAGTFVLSSGRLPSKK